MENSNTQTESLVSVVRGAGFFAIGKLIANILGFATNLLLTQAMGPTLFGVYTFARTIIETIGSITNLGTDKATLRFVSVHTDERGSELGLSYLLAITGGTIGAGGLYVVAPVITDYTLQNTLLTLTLRVLSVLMILQALIVITGNAFRAIDRPELDTLVKQVIQKVAILAFVALVFVLSLGFTQYLVGIMVAVALTAAVGLGILTYRTPLKPNLSIKEVNIRSYLFYSLPLSFKDAGSVLYTRIDILLIGGLLTSSAVGYYQVAILLTTLLTLPLTAINQIFPTVTSRLHSDENYETMGALYKTSTRWVLSGILPAAIGLIVYRNQILTLFGPEFTAASDLLILFTIGQLSNAVVGPSGYLLMMTDQQLAVTINQWAFGLFNVGLNLLLISEFGLIGAALATASVLIAINVARVVEVYYYNRIHPFSRKMLNPIAASIICCAIMIVAELTLPPLYGLTIGGAAGVLTYSLTLAIMGMEESDRDLINELRG